MPEIKLLDSSIYNRIAAGEVVERPASIVKELVENSIDAGANKIDVEITGGGIDNIIVSDNGCGIGAKELKLAFLPHATSKIKSADDLDSIGTLGFRGEALSSIAAVSKVKLVSKTVGSDSAGFIELEGGEVRNMGEVGAPKGTRVEVTNLFYNVPARHKFLKKPKQEESEITTIISRLILANPRIAFNYIVEGKRVFQSSGKSQEDAIIAVYSATTMQSIVPLSGSSAGLKLSGFVGKPSFAKPNRTYQTLVINGRYVVNYAVSAAVGKAYANFLMKSQFAFYVLYLDIPFDEVDVNVHPNKLEVRFEDGQKIFGLVMNAVETALLDCTKSSVIEINEKTRPSSDKDNQALATSSSLAENLREDTGIDNANSGVSVTQNLGGINTNAGAISQGVSEQLVQSTQIFEAVQRPSSSPQFSQGGGDYKIRSNSPIINEIILEKREAIAQEDLRLKVSAEAQQKSMFDSKISVQDFKINVRVVGKIYNTYLIIEYANSVYMIDQHAAHERVLYDIFIAEVTTKKVSAQGLLVPYILNVNHSEAQFLADNSSMLKDLGFEIDEFGYLSFKVSSVPTTLVGLDIGAFFNTLLADLVKDLMLTSRDILKDRIAQCACKAAVKGGMDLEESEIVALLNRIKETQMVLQCPHGRPIIVELTRNQIDKWFKRVL